MDSKPETADNASSRHRGLDVLRMWFDRVLAILVRDEAPKRAQSAGQPPSETSLVRTHCQSALRRAIPLHGSHERPGNLHS